MKNVTLFTLLFLFAWVFPLSSWASGQQVTFTVPVRIENMPPPGAYKAAVFCQIYTNRKVIGAQAIPFYPTGRGYNHSVSVKVRPFPSTIAQFTKGMKYRCFLAPNTRIVNQYDKLNPVFNDKAYKDYIGNARSIVSLVSGTL